MQTQKSKPQPPQVRQGKRGFV